MKRNFLFLTLFFLFTIQSCKDSKEQNLEDLLANGSVEDLKKYKGLVDKRSDSISQILGSLGKAIEEKDTLKKMVIVSTLNISIDSFDHFIDLQGSVSTENDIRLISQASGILTLFVKEGQKVRKGQVLGNVADNGLAQQVQAAESNILGSKQQVEVAKVGVLSAKTQAELAKIRFEKQSNLWNQKIGSEIQYLSAKTNYESAKQVIASAQSQVSAARSAVNSAQKQKDQLSVLLNNTKIRAPFDGVIDEAFLKTGQLVSPQSPEGVLRLISASKLKVEANLSEGNLSKIKKGSNVIVFIPALDRTLNSKVTRIGSAIDPFNRTFKIEIPIQNKDGLIKPNLVANLKINDYSKENAISIPNQYILEDENFKPYIYLAKNIKENKGLVEKRFIKVGEKSEGNVEIISGLKKDDKLITEGFDKVFAGDEIAIN